MKIEETLKSFAGQVLAECRKQNILPAEMMGSCMDSFSARVREGKLEDYKVSEQISLTVRGKWNGHIGTASTQSLDPEGIGQLLRGIRESAELIETDEQDEILPPDDSYSEVCSYEPSLEDVTAQQKIERAMEIDQRMHGRDERLIPDDTVVSSSDSSVFLINTEGMDLHHSNNMIYAYTSALAKDGDRNATGFKLLWGYSLNDIPAEKLAKECAEDALGKLYAGRIRSGSYPVLIRNSVMGDLLSTFSGIFSAENAQLGLSLLKGKQGQQVAAPCVTLTDDPLLPWGLGSSPFDREGAACYTKDIIAGGKLKTLLYNRKAAKKDGCRTTGNAAGGGHVAPSNLILKPGTSSFEKMLEGFGDGIYLTEVTGLHAGANPASGDFSLLSKGFEVHDGKIGRALEQFTVAGNFYRMLEDIQEVGSDLMFDGSPIGSPTVRVTSLSIAGE